MLLFTSGWERRIYADPKHSDAAYLCTIACIGFAMYGLRYGEKFLFRVGAFITSEVYFDL